MDWTNTDVERLIDFYADHQFLFCKFLVRVFGASFSYKFLVHLFRALRRSLSLLSRLHLPSTPSALGLRGLAPQIVNPGAVAPPLKAVKFAVWIVTCDEITA